MGKSRISATVFAVAAALCGCTQSTLAARLVDVAVVNRSTGERLITHRHDGKLYVAGTPGERYAIELRSRTGERVLTVVSVDGVNVLSGQTAAFGQSGYVLEGTSNYSISGWRKSMDEVAQFVFTSLADSYAARTGRPANVGVIGVAVFRERIAPAMLPYPQSAPGLGRSEEFRRRALEDGQRENDSARAAAPAPSAKAESAAGALSSRKDAAPPREVQERKRLGTGHGEREHAPTRTTEFVRASDSPDEVVTIHYDSRANLVARGIIRAPRFAEPTPFPGGGFVPDPRS